MSHSIVRGTTAADTATSSTIVIGYPTGKSAGNFKQGTAHKLRVMQQTFEEPEGVGFAFNAANVTLTYRGTTTIPSGSAFIVQLDEPGNGLYNVPIPERLQAAPTLPKRITESKIYRIDLGAPATAATNATALVQNVTIANGTANITLNGTLVSSNVSTHDVPRGVSVTSNANISTATLTVYGTDEYGATMVENISGPNNTTANGVKAFKTVTRVATNVNLTNVSIGTTDVLGLPVWLPGSGAAYIIREIADGATVAAGTAVAGLATTTVSTATTADVRGTYDPNGACNGTLSIALDVALPDPHFLGNPQFDG